MIHYIVGLDVATDPKKRFISLAKYNGNSLSLVWVSDGNDQPKLTDDVIHALRSGDKVLFALDAPLGWPASLGQELASHSAGSRLKYTPDEMFRRSTDRFIKEKINKQPLDVGADRIARTAYAALKIINELSAEIQVPILLAWSADIEKIGAIEVYPAATLIAHGRSASGYKGPDGRTARESILTWLAKSAEMSTELQTLLVSNDNALDSAICALAGQDFLLGNCYEPIDLALAKKEGWIWVKNM